jgi:hypothetical protein
VTKQYSRGGIRYGHIVDWQVAAEDITVAKDLFASIWRQFAMWQVERVSCWTPPQSSLRPNLQEVGLAPIGLRTNFCYFTLAPESTTALASSDAWSMQMADSDVY